MLVPNDQESVMKYLLKTWEAIEGDADSKGQAIPRYHREVPTDTGGQLWTSDYLQYLIYGRPPGKFPPPDKMLEFVQKHPYILASAKQQFKNITEQGLAFIIGRKIAREGSAIFRGEKPGVDFLGSMELNMPELLTDLGRNQALNIITGIRNGINRSK